jgi:phosphatidylserine decarboxylase
MVAIGFVWAGLVIILIALAIAAFFRDPERVAHGPVDAILSGADGKVCDLREGPLPGGPRDQIYRQVSVFMSPLNAHINRTPVGGEVLDIKYTAGEFRAAFRDDASDHNERNLMTFADSNGRRFVMVQVAGYLARRIVCRIRPGEKVERGQRIGLIMFGSRVDHFIPRQYRIAVAIGDRVRAGVSVIGEPG